MVMQGPGGVLVLGSGRGRAGPELFLEPPPLAARDRGGGAGAQGFHGATMPSAAPLQPTPEPLGHLLFYGPFTPNYPSHQVHRVMMNKAQGIPLIPMLPSWAKPIPSRGTETKATPLTPITLFWCEIWSPGLSLLLRMTGSRLCTALPAPSITAAHAGAEETPSPKNRWERPSWKGGGTAWRDRKGDAIKIEKQWPSAQQGQQHSPVSLPRGFS